MYNRYFPDNADAFSELYRPVDCGEEKTRSKHLPETRKKESDFRRNGEKFDLKRLLHGLDVEKMGILPLILLLLLLLDVDDEEKIIIIALAVIFGI